MSGTGLKVCVRWVGGVVGGWCGGWCKPITVFSLVQAEQYNYIKHKQLYIIRYFVYHMNISLLSSSFHMDENAGLSIFWPDLYPIVVTAYLFLFNYSSTIYAFSQRCFLPHWSS